MKREPLIVPKGTPGAIPLKLALIELDRMNRSEMTRALWQNGVYENMPLARRLTMRKNYEKP